MLKFLVSLKGKLRVRGTKKKIFVSCHSMCQNYIGGSKCIFPLKFYLNMSYVRWQLNGTNKKIVCFVKVWKPLGQDIGSFEDWHNFDDLWNLGKFLTKEFALVWHQFLIDFSLKWTKKSCIALFPSWQRKSTYWSNWFNNQLCGLPDDFYTWCSASCCMINLTTKKSFSQANEA